MSEIMNYQPNSHKSKTETKETPEKQIEKVTTGVVKTKKKSGFQKLADVFISEDASNVGSYIVGDVLIPVIKKAVSDIVTNGIDMILYGESGRGKKNTNASYVSYNSYSKRDDDRRGDRVRSRSSYSYDDLIFDTRGDAEEVLSRMDDIIEEYKMVSVADLYDLVGHSGNFTDHKYGWMNLRNAKVVRVREGYIIELPKALPLN